MEKMRLKFDLGGATVKKAKTRPVRTTTDDREWAVILEDWKQDSGGNGGQKPPTSCSHAPPTKGKKIHDKDDITTTKKPVEEKHKEHNIDSMATDEENKSQEKPRKKPTAIRPSTTRIMWNS